MIGRRRNNGSNSRPSSAHGWFATTTAGSHTLSRSAPSTRMSRSDDRAAPATRRVTPKTMPPVSSLMKLHSHVMALAPFWPVPARTILGSRRVAGAFGPGADERTGELVSPLYVHVHGAEVEEGNHVRGRV